MTLAVWPHQRNMYRFVIWPTSRNCRGPTRNKSLTTNRFCTSLYPKQHPAFHWNLNCCGAALLEKHLNLSLDLWSKSIFTYGVEKNSWHYVKTLSKAACDHRGRAKRPLLVWKTPNRHCGSVTVGFLFFSFFFLSCPYPDAWGQYEYKKQSRGRNGRHLNSATQSAFQGGRKNVG